MTADQIRSSWSSPSLPWLRKSRISLIILVLIIVAGAYVFANPARFAFATWMKSAEFNYGPIVPVVAFFMVFRDLQRSKAGFQDRKSTRLNSSH